MQHHITPAEAHQRAIEIAAQYATVDPPKKFEWLAQRRGTTKSTYYYHDGESLRRRPKVFRRYFKADEHGRQHFLVITPVDTDDKEKAVIFTDEGGSYEASIAITEELPFLTR